MKRTFLLISINIILLMGVLQFSQTTQKGFASDPPSSGDWVIDPGEEFTLTPANGTFTINGSIVIKGTLLLDQAVLVVDGAGASADIEFNITVLSGGILRIRQNSTINALTYQTQINVTNGATFELSDSYIKDVGANPEPGIIIGANDVVITNSSITSDFIGVSVEDVENLSILNTNITKPKGERAISLYNVTNSELKGNRIISDSLDGTGIYIDECANLEVSNNFINSTGDSFDGIKVSNSNNTIIKENTIHTATVMAGGVYLDSCNNLTVILNLVNTTYGTITGIYATDCKSGEISKNKLDTSVSGVTLYDTQDINVTDNTVNSSTNFGIRFIDVNNTLIRNNTVYAEGTQGISGNNANFTQIVQNKVIYPNVDGIYLINSNKSTICNNLVIGAGNNGILTDDTPNIEIQGNTISDCSNIGMYIAGSLTTYATITDNQVSNTNIAGSGTGMRLNSIQHSYLSNNSVANSGGYGSYILSCSNLTIENHSVKQSGDDGLYFNNIQDSVLNNIISEYSPNNGFEFSSGGNITLKNSISRQNNRGIHFTSLTLNVTVSACLFEKNYIGIYLIGADEIVIKESDITENQYGIYFYQDAQYNKILNNRIYKNIYGFYTDQEDADNNSLHFNDIYLSQKGIYIDNADDWEIYNNTIAWCGFYGLHIDTGSQDHKIYYNAFFQNNIHARDDNTAGDNFWSNQQTVGPITYYFGNYWDDYTGSDVTAPFGFGDTPYTVPGAPNVEDQYPLVNSSDIAAQPPQTCSPVDIAYIFSTTGHSIYWDCHDWDPLNYTVYHNGLVYESGSWDGLAIEVGIDGLPLGLHTFQLELWDELDHSAIDEVKVSVTAELSPDTTPPILNQPGNVAAPNETLTGYWINWTATDINPATFEIWQNGSSIETGTWMDGVPINFSLEGLGLTNGTYNFSIVVWDGFSNYANSTVLVYVGITDTTAPTVNSPDDVIYIVGDIGNNITWIAFDQFGKNYLITRNGSEVAVGPWNGGNIIVNVDGLAQGIYEYEVTVYDWGGQSASDIVYVYVGIEVSKPEDGEGDDQFLSGFFLGAGLVASAVVILTLLWKVLFGRGGKGD